jgi:Uma2 family endonuclease
MSPTYGWHRKLQFRIAQMLEARLPEGEGVIELAVHTRAGTKVPDAAWCSPAVWAQHRDALGASVAPEICVEVRSPSTTDAEMAAKRALYFEAGAEEVWICDADGTMHVYDASGELDTSRCAPNFPARVEL